MRDRKPFYWRKVFCKKDSDREREKNGSSGTMNSESDVRNEKLLMTVRVEQ